MAPISVEADGVDGCQAWISLYANSSQVELLIKKKTFALKDTIISVQHQRKLRSNRGFCVGNRDNEGHTAKGCR